MISDSAGFSRNIEQFRVSGLAASGPSQPGEAAVTHPAASPAPASFNGGLSADRLRSLIGQIEDTEGRKRVAVEDIKDLYNIAKSEGFNPKVMRRIVKERRLKRDDVEREETLLDVYRRALAGWDSTPLASFAKAAE